MKRIKKYFLFIYFIFFIFVNNNCWYISKVQSYYSNGNLDTNQRYDNLDRETNKNNSTKTIIILSLLAGKIFLLKKFYLEQPLTNLIDDDSLSRKVEKTSNKKINLEKNINYNNINEVNQQLNVGYVTNAMPLTKTMPHENKQNDNLENGCNITMESDPKGILLETKENKINIFKNSKFIIKQMEIPDENKNSNDNQSYHEIKSLDNEIPNPSPSSTSKEDKSIISLYSVQVIDKDNLLIEKLLQNNEKVSKTVIDFFHEFNEQKIPGYQYFVDNSDEYYKLYEKYENLLKNNKYNDSYFKSLNSQISIKDKIEYLIFKETETKDYVYLLEQILQYSNYYYNKKFLSLSAEGYNESGYTKGLLEINLQDIKNEDIKPENLRNEIWEDNLMNPFINILFHWKNYYKLSDLLKNPDTIIKNILIPTFKSLNNRINESNEYKSDGLSIVIREFLIYDVLEFLENELANNGKNQESMENLYTIIKKEYPKIKDLLIKIKNHEHFIITEQFLLIEYLSVKNLSINIANVINGYFNNHKLKQKINNLLLFYNKIKRNVNTG